MSIKSKIAAAALVALAVTGASRTETLPEVPTVAESGLPGYAATGWYAMFGPDCQVRSREWAVIAMAACLGAVPDGSMGISWS